ncbi:MAG: DUF4163 domain-containing protein [Lachnospiraceae bacterium]|nr:DUF4163 domain-containing protein [Lachnospiraceae bacterium]
MKKNTKSLKKIIGMMLVLALTVSITACSGKKDTNQEALVTPTPEVTVEPTATPIPEPTQEPTPTVEPTVTPEADGQEETTGEVIITNKMHEAFGIEEKQVTETIVGKNSDTELYHYSIRYPQIVNPENLATINQVNKLIADEVAKAGKQYMTDHAGLDKADVSGKSPYSNTRTYEVTFNKNYIISIVYTDVHAAGGPYSVETRTSYTYDLSTGKKLEAVDLMKMSKQEVYDMISESFTTIINEEPDRFFENARDIAVQEAPNAGFYLQNGCLMFYFNEDVLAPHAGGIQEFGSDISSIPESYKEPERLL